MAEIKKYPSKYHEQADEMLDRIRSLRADRDRLATEVESKLQAVRNHYAARLAGIEAELAAYERALLHLIKAKKRTLFADADKVILKCGALIMQIQLAVKRSRDMLSRLKAAGRTDVIRVAETVNWDALETWPDEELAAIGAERIRKESFSYEIK